MTSEIISDLRTNVATGLGHKAWHFDAADAASVANYFGDDAVPFSVVQSLLDVPVAEAPAEFITPDGFFPDPSRKVIYNRVTGHVISVMGNTYPLIPFADTLVRDTAAIVGGTDSMVVGSVGTLKHGAVGWVQIESPDTRETCGVQYKPWIMATTSHDGSLARVWQRGSTFTVCDNTHSAFMAEGGAAFKIKKTAGMVNIGEKIMDARTALGLVQREADAVDTAIRALVADKVTDGRFDRWLSKFNPIPDAKGRAQTMAETKRDALRRLWVRDERVSPWRGTALGVLQAANTYAHHESIVRGATRDERNMLRNLDGSWADVNAEALKVLATV